MRAINSNLKHSLIELLYFLELSGFDILILKHLMQLVILFIFLIIILIIICFQTLLEKVLISLNEVHINVKQIIVWLIFVRFAKIFVEYTALKRYFLEIFWDFYWMLLKGYWKSFDFELGSRGILDNSLSFPIIRIIWYLHPSIENTLNVLVCSFYLIIFTFVCNSGLLGIWIPVYVPNYWVIRWTHFLTTIFYI